MNSIQEIGFAYPIIAANADYPPGKIKGAVGIILKLNQRYGTEKKH
jgi:hypothetical protein